MRISARREFQAQVVQMARTFGWLVYHTYNSENSEPGFPDLTMVRERVVFCRVEDNQGAGNAASAEMA